MIRAVAVGELLWDLLPAGDAIGGAPYNFAVHLQRLGHDVAFASAVGDDERGRRALSAVGSFARHVRTVAGQPTGVARVNLGGDGQPAFEIVRPAAYDFTSVDGIDCPDWWAHGTLFAWTAAGARSLDAARVRFRGARRFCDVNLRPGQWSDDLLLRLLPDADAAKLSETEMITVARLTGLPLDPEAFCAAAPTRLGWRSVAVTLGPDGCVVAAGGDVARCPGYPIRIADAVGAGDAFSAAFLHGIANGWSAQRTGDFANRLGAVVASRTGATPDWSQDDLDRLTLR